MKYNLFLIFLLFANSLHCHEKSNNKLILENYNFEPIYYHAWVPSIVNPRALKNNVIIAKELLKKHPKSYLLITGYSGFDFLNPNQYDQKLYELSVKRAKSTANALKQLGIPENRIAIKAVGKKYSVIRPLPNDTYETYHQRNQEDRKSEIEFINPENDENQKKDN